MTRDRIVHITERTITLRESDSMPLAQPLPTKIDSPPTMGIKEVGISAIVTVLLSGLLLMELWPTY